MCSSEFLRGWSSIISSNFTSGSSTGKLMRGKSSCFKSDRSSIEGHECCAAPAVLIKLMKLEEKAVTAATAGAVDDKAVGNGGNGDGIKYKDSHHKDSFSNTSTDTPRVPFQIQGQIPQGFLFKYKDRHHKDSFQIQVQIT